MDPNLSIKESGYTKFQNRFTLVRALFYCHLNFLDHRTNISRKVGAPRRVSLSGAPNKFQNCHLDKTNIDKTSQHRCLCFLTSKGLFFKELNGKIMTKKVKMGSSMGKNLGSIPWYNNLMGFISWDYPFKKVDPELHTLQCWIR